MDAREWFDAGKRIARQYGAMLKPGQDPWDLPMDLFLELARGEDDQRSRDLRRMEVLDAILG